MIVTEKEVLHHLVLGLTSVQIAKQFKVSLRTVEYRRSKLMKKFRARTPFHLGYKIAERN